MTNTEDLLLRDLLEGPADEIYDIPEFEDEDKFDVEGYINGNIDYWIIMNLEILKQREQLMEDIDSICDDFFYSNYNGDISEAEELIRTLCDAVCKNFPTN